ncbi:hypothetical protein BO94DRAFT_571499 [Aspergillus sclerotioniger CBS 115572]|uniref:Protein kinase domain-containing protein n=1 Tax=Aspergillus sclerotioniger CBS 115572 TaxID=1450535 RepID=A0A317XD09_9EURO|nr:hypothetical protein BO94DRAFT_571499 [Aspergillus sclerotioniger CBS 115572]PWY96021.1 hypothetical protein BO94DRAFT_571499 [Aspergillus sclerotioniger CBS 115572]
MDRVAKRSTSLPSSRKGLHGNKLVGNPDSTIKMHIQVPDKSAGSTHTDPEDAVSHLQPDLHTATGRRDIRDRSLAIPLPIRPDPQIVRQTSSHQDNGNVNYIKIWELDQAGRGFIALKDADRLPLVLLKTRSSITPKQKRSLQKAFHQNLIGLYGFQSDGSNITFIYRLELLAVSLACVSNSPRVQFSESDAATISKEVLLGLDYIHSELEIIHGDIDCANIVLNTDGEVKIANIGDSMIRGIDLSSRNHDLRGTGKIIANLIDPTTRITGEPILCDEVAHSISSITSDFIKKATEGTTAKALLKHNFLSIATPTGSWSLKPLVVNALPFAIKFGKHLEDGS